MKQYTLQFATHSSTVRNKIQRLDAFSEVHENWTRSEEKRSLMTFFLLQDEVQRKKEQDSRTLYIRLKCLVFGTWPGVDVA